MKTLTDLPARILAAIDATETDARDAAAGPWIVERTLHIDHEREPSEWVSWMVQRSIDEDPGVEVVSYGTRDEGDGLSEANAAHIARHDPARVLARCAADRDIVAQHTAADHCMARRPFDSEWTDTCPTLRALAAGYGIESEPDA